ncbi:helix-turn-helix domain-containing protein [Methanosalsum natronophilum]|uniref:helix-turn-helix domain-containing protein n=1 Tax=Methanosalsum natronophilum TaxID=768733 RepID=UPI002167B9EC|nr:hypothetical protein [Methanosalsum natronophilum]MCS3924105.1 CRP-like cAMP-binding protein [Methanosalsum natronophilum]
MGTQKEPFVPNIPKRYIEKLAKLPCTSFRLFVCVWYVSRVKKSTKDLKLSKKELESFGICRRTLSRALDKLEAEGVVVSDRSVGRSPRITLSEDWLRGGELVDSQ